MVFAVLVAMRCHWIAKASHSFLAAGSQATRARSSQATALRILIIEFPSLEKAIAAHDSAAYQEALKELGNGAMRDVRIVEGVE